MRYFLPLLFPTCVLTAADTAADVADHVPVALFQTQPELEVTVWAKSPLLKNPTNLDVDAMGRIWVAEGVNYRSHQDRQPAGDRIVILEDKDHDGVADTSSVFVQEEILKAPLGVAVFDNVVVVSMTPDLIVYTDVNRDLKFDPAVDKREVILTGFNGRIHDHSLHSVVGGPDGRWYWSAGNCGAQFKGKDDKTFRIGSPYDPFYGKKKSDFEWSPKDLAGQKSDDGRVWLGGFAARMLPDTSKIEIIGHNFRNSYEQCVTSFGEVFQNDNDDPPACRVSYLMEGGNAGFCSFDGKRAWAADKRPGQDVPTAEWRQEDPGAMPAGDVYGGGSPTGVTFYENGALGDRFPGLLLTCEPGRNTIFGYFPTPDGAGYHLERFNFLTTNVEGKFAGSDFLGGAKSVKSELNTKFRPSDVVVGVDGALYVSDWFDARVGGHSDLDDQTLGTIYRIAPKGFKSSAPKIDLSTAAGCVEALRSSGANVRFTALQKLTTMAQKALPVVKEAAKTESNPYFKARFAWALTLLGTEGCQALEKAIDAKMPDDFRMLAFRALKRAHHNAWEWTVKGSVDPSPQVRREAALALRDVAFDIASPLLVALFKGFDGADRTYLEALGTACEGKESKAFFAMTKTTTETDPLKWSPAIAKLAWRLHPAELTSAFAKRAQAETLSLTDRKEALVALGYTADKSAATAMVEVASKLPKGPLKDLADWWLLNRKDNLWKDHGLAEVLKTTGLYDPDKIVLVPTGAPAAEPAKFTVEEVLKLTGEPKNGAQKIATCFACHRLGPDGMDYAPNLTGWAQRQTKEVLIRSIIDPSFDIAHGYEGKHIILKDAMELDGIVVSDGDPVMIQSMGGLTQRVPRNRIKEIQPLPRSLMLSADQMSLSAQDLADLVAYLHSLK